MSQQQSDKEQLGRVVRVLGLEDSERTDRALGFKKPEEWKLGRSEIPVDTFRHRVTEFLDSMREVVSSLPTNYGGYRLDQVTFNAEISAKGQISLLGSGGEVAGKAGLSFTFNRSVDEPSS